MLQIDMQWDKSSSDENTENARECRAGSGDMSKPSKRVSRSARTSSST